MPKSNYLILSVFLSILAAACGETLLAEGGSYCTPSAEQRSEDCYLNDGDAIYIEEVSDLDSICNTSCNRIRKLSIHGRRVAGLTNLKALRGITVESVDLTGVPDLRTTRGLSLAQGAGVLMERNPNLEEFVVEEPLDEAIRLEVVSNPKLNSLSALFDLREFGGKETQIRRKYHLRDIPISDLDFIDGLKLTSGAYFQIRNLDNVTEAPKLSGEASIIQIEQNDKLNDVSGLAGIDRITGSFTVSGNPNVKNCAAEEVAQHINFHDRARIYVRENGTGSCE